MKTRKIKLGDLGEWGSGGTPLASRADYYGGEIPWLIIEDLNDGLVSKSVKKITKAGLENSSAKIVPAGTLLIAMYGSIGKLGITNMECATNQAIAFCKCDSTQVDTRFLFSLLLNERAKFIHAGRGGTQQNINQEFLKDYEIPLPDLSEQQRIAGRLEAADRLRRTRRYALELNDGFLPAAFLQLFGDLQNGAGEKTQLQDAAEIITGYPFTSVDYVSTGETVKLCRGANVLPDRIDWSDLACWPESETAELRDYKLECGDIVMAMDRPWISEGFKVAMIQPEDCPSYLVQRVARLRGKDGVPNAFLYHLLRQPAFTRHCRPTETTIPHISPTDIQTFSFHLPPLPLQQKFAALVARVERLRAVQCESLRQAEHLFQSLLNQAFSSST